MSSNKKVVLTLALIVVIALSFLLFLGIGDGEKSPVQISAFIFVIVSELITYGAILGVTSKNSNTFSTAGILSLTSIYLVASLIVNILLKSLFTTLRGILVCNFSILLIYTFIAMIIIFFKKEN